MLHTSFRPHLAVTPLCFAIPSSLSDWEEDFHLQAVEHARHTDRIDGAAVDGRKRVLLADTEGLVQALRVVPASVQDRDTPALIEPELAAGGLRQVWADLAFAGERAAAPLARHRIALELVGRRDKTGFAVEPRRWKIKPTFGCLQVTLR